MKLLVLLAFVAPFGAFAQVDCHVLSNSVEINGYSHTNIQDVLEAVDAVEPSKISFYGEITESTIDRLIKKINRALEDNQAEQKEIVINMDSNGGDINHAIRAVRHIRALNREPNIIIHTKVTSHNSCESACTILYTAGEKRFASKRAKFGFHSPKFVRGEVDGMTRDDIEELFREKWLGYVKAIDQTAASTIDSNRYLYSDRMSYMRGEELETGYVTDRL